MRLGFRKSSQTSHAATISFNRKEPSAAQPQPKTILATEGTEGTPRSQSRAKNLPSLWLLCLLRALCEKNLHGGKHHFQE